MRTTISLLLAGLLMAASAGAQVATTQTGAVSKGAMKSYAFIPATFGQVTATLSWDAPAAHLLMVMVCGSTDPQSFGIAAGLLDRFARFEAGIIAGEPCALVVNTIDEPANFRLLVTRTGDQTLTASAAGFAAFAEARPGTFVVDEAMRVAAQIGQLIRR